MSNPNDWRKSTRSGSENECVEVRLEEASS